MASGRIMNHLLCASPQGGPHDAKMLGGRLWPHRNALSFHLSALPILMPSSLPLLPLLQEVSLPHLTSPLHLNCS